MNKLTQKSRYTASLLPKLFLSSRVNDKKTSSNLEKLQNGPSLSDFIKNDQNGELENSGNLEETVGHITEHPYIDHSVFHGEGRKGKHNFSGAFLSTHAIFSFSGRQ